MHHLYRITNTLNDNVYVGQTVNDKKRWRAHKSYAKQENPVQYIHRAMAKYGIDNFVFEVIATCKTQEDADKTEATLINQYNSRNKKYGYNLAPGGNVTWIGGQPPEYYPMYGKHHTKEHKQYMSNLFKGRIMAPPATKETRQKMSESQMGHVTSLEARKRISESNIGKTFTDEHKQKLSDIKIDRPSNFTGKTHSKQTKDLLSGALSKLNDSTQLQIVEDYNNGISVKELLKQYDCSQRTIYRIIDKFKKR